MIDENGRQALASTTGNETILLVEDEDIIRIMLVEVLTFQGYTVLQAGRGVDALNIISKLSKPMDILVTDMSMPGMTGWDLAKTIRATHPALPILFVSGHNDNETSRWGKMDGPVEHLFKPFSLEAFLAKARQMLDNAKNKAKSGTREETTTAGS